MSTLAEQRAARLARMREVAQQAQQQASTPAAPSGSGGGGGGGGGSSPPAPGYTPATQEILGRLSPEGDIGQRILEQRAREQAQESMQPTQPSIIFGSPLGIDTSKAQQQPIVSVGVPIGQKKETLARDPFIDIIRGQQQESRLRVAGYLRTPPGTRFTDAEGKTHSKTDLLLMEAKNIRGLRSYEQSLRTYPTYAQFKVASREGVPVEVSTYDAPVDVDSPELKKEFYARYGEPYSTISANKKDFDLEVFLTGDTSKYEDMSTWSPEYKAKWESFIQEVKTKPYSQRRMEFFGSLPVQERIFRSVGELGLAGFAAPITIAQLPSKMIFGKTLLPDVGQKLEEKRLGPQDVISSATSEVWFGQKVPEWEKEMQRRYPVETALGSITGFAGTLVGFGGASKIGKQLIRLPVLKQSAMGYKMLFSPITSRVGMFSKWVDTGVTKGISKIKGKLTPSIKPTTGYKDIFFQEGTGRTEFIGGSVKPKRTVTTIAKYGEPKGQLQIFEYGKPKSPLTLPEQWKPEVIFRGKGVDVVEYTKTLGKLQITDFVNTRPIIIHQYVPGAMIRTGIRPGGGMARGYAPGEFAGYDMKGLYQGMPLTKEQAVQFAKIYKPSDVSKLRPATTLSVDETGNVQTSIWKDYIKKEMKAPFQSGIVSEKKIITDLVNPPKTKYWSVLNQDLSGANPRVLSQPKTIGYHLGQTNVFQKKSYLMPKDLQETVGYHYTNKKDIIKFVKESNPWAKQKDIPELSVEGGYTSKAGTPQQSITLFEQPGIKKVFKQSGTYEYPDFYTGYKVEPVDLRLVSRAEQGIQTRGRWRQTPVQAKPLVPLIRTDTKIVSLVTTSPIRIRDTVFKSKYIVGELPIQKINYGEISGYKSVEATINDVLSGQRFDTATLQASESLSESMQESMQMQEQVQVSLQRQEQQQRFESLFDTMSKPTSQFRTSYPGRPIVPRETKTTRTIIPKIPMFPGEEKRKQVSEKGHDVYIKDRQYVAGKKRYKESWFKANKQPLSKQDALSLGASAVDNSAAATFKIKPASDKKARPLKIAVTNWGSISNQFYKKGNRYIEKTTHRINTPGEIQGISAKGWIAQRRTTMPMSIRQKPRQTKQYYPQPVQLINLKKILRGFGV